MSDNLLNIIEEENINLLENKSLDIKPTKIKLKTTEKELVTKLILSLPELCEMLLKNKNKTYIVKYKPSAKKTYKINITLYDNK